MAQTSEKHNANALSMKARVAMLFLIPLLVICASSAAVVITARTLVNDDVYTPEQKTEYALPFYTNEKEIQKQLIGLMDAVSDSNTVSVRTGISVSVDDGKIEGTVNDAQKSIIKHIKGGILSDLSHVYEVYRQNEDGSFECKASDYGEPNEYFLSRSVYTKLTDVRCEDRENGTYTYKASFPAQTAERHYSGEREKAENKIKQDYADVFTVLPDSKAELEGVNFTADVNAEDKTVKKVSIERIYTVTAHIRFTGEYAELGEQTLTFEYKVKPEYTVSFAGIAIEKKEIKINKNGYEQIKLVTHVSDQASKEDFTLTFTSSDESLLTVDETGMVEATGTESAAPVTVIATLNYLGNTYTAECEVYIITEADGINISEAKLALKPGEEYTLTAEPTPKKATIRDIMWISTDEAVLTVNEAGLVTAKAPGEAQVIAVTRDGGFMKACHVTVADSTAEGGNK